MNSQAPLESKEVDGVLYQILVKPHGFTVIVKDLDSDEVVHVLLCPTEALARAHFEKAVAGVGNASLSL